MKPTIEELLEFYKILHTDLIDSVKKMNSEDSDFGYFARAYMRAYSSWIEGSIWLYKEMIRRLEYQWHKDLPTEYQLYLFEYDWSFSNSGEPIIGQKKIKTKQNLKAFFHVMEKLVDHFSVDTGEDGWEQVMYFYKIRDSLMHPSNSSSLEISRDMIKKCDKGRLWLNGHFSNLSEALVAKSNA